MLNFNKTMSTVGILLAWSLPSKAQEFDDGRPVYSANTERITPFLSSAPRNLAAQKLSASQLPEEAEIFCSSEYCAFGFSHGIAFGGDILGMTYTPFRQYFDPFWNGGNLYIIDFFGGFQILRQVDNKVNMNAQIGFRRISHTNFSNTISNQGLTAKINYSHEVTPVYLQSLHFEAYFAGDSTSTDNSIISANSPNHQNFMDSASYFYRILHKYPTYFFSLPADIEIINWNSDQTGLSAPIRAYAHFEPFYRDNYLSFSYPNLFLKKQEQNFGLRLTGLFSYESTQNFKAGRFAVLSAIGIDIQTSDLTTTESGNAGSYTPTQRFLQPFINLAGSYQF